MDKPKKQKLGALWAKNVGGKQVLSGSYEPEGRDGPKTRIEIWPNGFKNKPNDPDFVIYLDTFVPKGRAAPVAESAPAPSSDDNDPVPF